MKVLTGINEDKTAFYYVTIFLVSNRGVNHAVILSVGRNKDGNFGWLE